MAKLKAGLIGCGGRGRSHALGYLAADAELVACADLVGATAAQCAADLGIARHYEDYRELLEREKPDVVSICLWTGLHLDAVLASVAAGVQLINCEKPMAPTWGDARRMHEVCAAAGVRLTFSHQTRYGPTFQKVRELVREGAIGQLLRIEGFCSNLFDLGTHRFDRMFFYNEDQPVEWVMGQVNCADDLTIFGIPIETHGISYVQWKNGVAGLLVTGETSPIQDRLIGTEGMIENSGRDAVRVLRKGGADWEVLPLRAREKPDGETTLYILDAISWLQGGAESSTSSRRALQGAEVIFSTYESARRRARVYLPLEIEDSPLLSMLAKGEIEIPPYPAQLRPEEEAEGFRLLFNGRDLEGWKIIGPATSWSARRGLLACDGEGRGWIRPLESFADFVLRLEYRIGAGGDSGIFLRTSEADRPAYQGMEIQLLDAGRSPLTAKSNGGIYDAVAPAQEASRPAGSWNAIEVSCQGPRVRVVLNGKEVVHCDTSVHPELKERLQCGFIGLQNHGAPIDFRNVRIRAD